MEGAKKEVGSFFIFASGDHALSLREQPDELLQRGRREELREHHRTSNAPSSLALAQDTCRYFNARPQLNSEGAGSACFAVAVEINCTIVGKHSRAHWGFRD